jgi:hypothetical protein
MSTSVLGQGRTIEDTLVVTDPTVAKQGNWKIGAAAEYWATKTQYDIYNSAGTKVGDSNLSLNQSGFNIFAAYGNFTLQGTRRSGSGDYTVNESGFQYGGPQKQTDQEYTLRWLFPHETISPYLLVGYGKTEVKQDLTLTTPGFVWTCTGTTTLTQTTTYKGALIGGGAIVPFNEKVGMRGDMRLHFNKGDNTYTGTGCKSTDGSGVGYDMTLTAYWNIIGGLNAQLGGKMTWLNAGTNVPDWFKWGIFGMIGYSLSF